MCTEYFLIIYYDFFFIFQISGCDLMVCGRDYHGNPIGNGSGCGANFRWSTAPSYQPRTGEELVPAEIEMVEPERVSCCQILQFESWVNYIFTGERCCSLPDGGPPTEM